MTPEVMLWRSVIIQAILDALGLFPEPSYTNRFNQREALDWMKSGEINTISDYADTNPDYIKHLFNRLKIQRHLRLFETEELLKNAFFRPREFTVYSNEE
tara:strand:- start:4320 stop:4619 length:300 start_codon:yes stop_codon:yes gene_type:complete